MFKHIFELDKTIGIYPMISLAIFFLFFAGLLFWVVKVDKIYIGHMRNLPLEDGAQPTASGKDKKTLPN